MPYQQGYNNPEAAGERGCQITMLVDMLETEAMPELTKKLPQCSVMFLTATSSNHKDTAVVSSPCTKQTLFLWLVTPALLQPPMLSYHLTYTLHAFWSSLCPQVETAEDKPAQH